MTMTDPIADMLTRVRNANQAYHDTTTMPHSKIKVHIAEILVNEGYIASYAVNDPAEGEVGKTLSITLKYGQNRERSCHPYSGRNCLQRCDCGKIGPGFSRVSSQSARCENAAWGKACPWAKRLC